MKQLSNPRCMQHKYIDLFHYLFKLEKGPNQIAIKNVFFFVTYPSFGLDWGQNYVLANIQLQ